MHVFINLCQWLSVLSFFFYGFACLFSPWLVDEFKRFGLAKYRILTGILELAGASGLLLGFLYSPILVASSLGLVLLMAAGTIVRVYIGDSLLQTAPAVFYLILNLVIFLHEILRW